MKAVIITLSAMLFLSGCLDDSKGKLVVKNISSVDPSNLTLVTPPGSSPPTNPPFVPPVRNPPLYQQNIDVSKCVPEGQYGCLITEPNLPEPSDSTTARAASKVVIFENGIEIGPGHSLHAELRDIGKGRYSHWLGTLRITASDNSNPATNGRKYTYGIEGVTSPPPATPLVLGNFNGTLNGGDQVTIPVTSGNPPYTFTVLSGGGTITNAGVFTAPTASSRIMVRVSDSRSQTTTVNLRSQVMHFMGGSNNGSQDNSWSSHDGISWVSNKPIPVAIQGLSLLVLNDILHLFGGYTNTATSMSYKTQDVKGNWSSIPPLPRSLEMAGKLVHNGKIYIAAQDRILISSDGTNFTYHGDMPMAPENMGGTQLTFFNGKFWLIAGANFTANYAFEFIYNSVDAKAWEYVGTLPLALYSGALFNFNNKLYFAGGRDGNNDSRKEVYSSSDGINWSMVGNLPAPRSHIRGVIYKNKMWIIGGDEAGVPQTSVLSSSDGVTWTNVGQIPSARFNGDAVVY